MNPLLKDLTKLMSAKQIVSIARSAERTISLWVGAVSAGKTIASLFAFLIALRNVGDVGQIVIIGKTLQTIERNVIDQLRTHAIFGKLADQVLHTTGSNRAIILGREVALIGANNITAEERIRGGTFALVYVDEATLLPYVFWQMLVTRLRVKGARLIATTNPASKNHWLRKEFILRAAEVDMLTFHLTMYDNPSLEPEYIERMERTYTGVFYDRFILGLWTNAEGAIYPTWNADIGGGNVIRWENMPPIRRILGVALDYGTTNPTVALMLGLTDERLTGSYDPAPRLILLDEWVDDPKITKRNHSPSEHAALYRAWRGGEHWPDTIMPLEQRIRPFTIVDPAAKAFREELNRPVGAEPAISTVAADNSVLEGIADVSNLISRQHPNGGSLLQATDRCARWNEEITEYQWDPDKTDEGEDKPLKQNDHAMDAGRYVVRTTKALWLPPMRTAHKIAA